MSVATWCMMHHRIIEKKAPVTLEYGIQKSRNNVHFFLNRNHVYKNVEAQISKKLRTC